MTTEVSYTSQSCTVWYDPDCTVYWAQLQYIVQMDLSQHNELLDDNRCILRLQNSKFFETSGCALAVVNPI